MENKGKRIWTIILTIYLTLVTIGCGLFGYLYFSTRFGGNNKMSFADAKVLVSAVCSDLELTTNSNDISSQSWMQDGDRTDWNGEIIPFLDPNRTTITKSYLNVALQLANTAMQYNMEEGKYYKLPDDDYYGFYYNLTNKGIKFNLLRIKNHDTENNYQGNEFVITGTPDAYIVHHRLKFTTFGGDNLVLIAAIGEVEKDDSGVFRCYEKVYNIYTDYYDGRDDLKNKVATLEKVDAVGYAEYNIKTHKQVLLADSSSVAEMGEDYRALTDAEAVEFVNEMIDDFRSLTAGTPEDFKNLTFVDVSTL